MHSFPGIRLDALSRRTTVLLLVCSIAPCCLLAGGTQDQEDMPAWALSIPAPPRPFTAGFLHWSRSGQSGISEGGEGGEGGEGDDGRHERCALSFDNYGENCGMCRGDCKPLSKALKSQGALRRLSEEPDVIVVSPELAVKPGTRPSQSWWADSRAIDAALPRRPPGKFYLVRKYRAGMAFRCADVPPKPTTPPSRRFRRRLMAVKKPKPLNCSWAPSPTSREGSCDSFCRLLYRPDVIWTNFDMADHDIKDDTLAARILSVTLPAGSYRYKGDAWARFRGKPANGTDTAEEGGEGPPLLAWFRGNCHGGELHTSTARYDLARAFSPVASTAASASTSPATRTRPDVQLDWYFEAKDFSCPGIEGPRGQVHNDKEAKAAAAKWFSGRGDYFGTMLRSAFGFVPHGFARWNLRFLELLSAGTIPVVIADGLRMPFEQLIPWDDVIVRLSEETVRRGDPDEILAPLIAMSPAEVRRRGRLALHVFDTYFSSADAKVTALLAATGVIVADGANASAHVPSRFGECRTTRDRRQQCTVLGLQALWGGPPEPGSGSDNNGRSSSSSAFPSSFASP